MFKKKKKRESDTGGKKYADTKNAIVCYYSFRMSMVESN